MSQITEVVVFWLDQQLFGVPVSKIREIMTYQSPTQLPNTAPCIKGVVNIRGEVTPVLDLRIKFHISEAPCYLPTTPVIATKTGDGRMIGIVVDAIDGFEEICLDEQVDIPESSEGGIGKEYLKGVYRLPSKDIFLLDTDKTLAVEELEK